MQLGRNRQRVRARFLGSASGGTPPSNTVLPSINGVNRADLPLLAVVGSWTGATSYAYQWIIDGLDVSGATSLTWTPGSARIGTTARLRVTATGPGGSTSATSDPMVLSGNTLIDDFPTGSTTDLSTYRGPLNQAYQKVNTGTPVVSVQTNGWANSNSSSASVAYRITALPLSVTGGDYIVGCRMRFTALTSGIFAGPIARQPTGTTIAGYMMRYTPLTNAWELLRSGTGGVIYDTNTSLTPLAVNDEVVVTVQAIGSGASVDVIGKVYAADGTTLLLTLTATDSSSPLVANGTPTWWYGRSAAQIKDMSIGTAGNAGVAAANDPVVEMNDNGVWTWFNYPNQVIIDDYPCVSSLTFSGTDTAQMRFARNQDGVISRQPFATPTVNDNDHSNPSMLLLPDGKLMMIISEHNGDVFYRVSTDNTYRGYTSSITLYNGSAGVNSYTRAWLAPDGYVRILSRRNSGGSGTNPTMLFSKLASEIMAGDTTWALPVNQLGVAANTGRPYPVIEVDDLGRVYLFTTGDHPNETTAGPPARDSTLYLYIGTPGASGALDWTRADGTSVATGWSFSVPVTTEAGAVIQDTSAGQNWTWGVHVGSDGTIYLASTKYPGYTGTTNVPRDPGGPGLSNIEYWLHKVVLGDGTPDSHVVTSYQFATGQYSIYGQESCYAGGLQIDGNDPTIIYSSERVGGALGFDEIFEWDFNWDTGSRTLARSITPAATEHQRRPNCLRNAHPRMTVAWWGGTYVEYTDYLTKVYAVGARK